jgi:hypothetical protein
MATPARVPRFRYASPVPLVACPFCREMFEHGEETKCPVCGMSLVAFEKLPPSHDAASEDGVPTVPEHEELPFRYWKRGRGALVVLALVGLVLFMLPWIHVTVPDDRVLTGWSLARRLGWSWGAGVAWFVLVPIALTRRTIVKMRGARVAAAALAAFPGMTCAILWARPPHAAYFDIRFDFQWPFWATLALSLVAVFFAVRFGGRVDDIAVRRGTSQGQTVH